MNYSTRTVDRRESAIKKKLTAAIAMLLVSCIMVVTSTYAWFTLSTAPEVTGIQTSIGGNGNLEIALGSPDNWLSGSPQTIVNGSDLSTYEKNITWGNLIDLSPNSGYNYGWSEMTLYPSALNIDDSGKVGQSFINIPKYGADGRVTGLSNQVVSGIFSEGAFLTNGYGVRAIGASSSMTERQFDYKYAIEGIASAQKLTKDQINVALQDNGNVLGNIAVKFGLEGTENAEFTQEDMDGIESLLTATSTAVSNIELGIVNYVKGLVASKASQSIWDDDQYNSIINPLMNTLEFNQIKKAGEDVITVANQNVPNAGSVVELLDDYAAVKATLTSAQEKFDDKNTGKETYEWSDISEVLKLLMDVESKDSKITVAGMTLAAINNNTSAAVSTILGKLTSNEKIVVELGQGSSVFYEIAEIVGSLSSKVEITIVAEGITSSEGLPVTVFIESNITGDSKLTTASKAVTIAGSPDKMETSDNTSKIDDVYAYALDFFFRTNAENSKLLLQTNPAQRIYKDGTNLNTLGNGSSMTFTSDGLDEDIMVSLMKAIKIVFISADAKTDREIIASAALDLGTSTVDGKVTKHYDVSSNGDITADIRLYKTVDGQQVLITDDNEAQELFALDKNYAHKMTVLVYLDGNLVENGDVANAAKTMTGTMNLQFASSAELVPMDYTELNQMKKEEDQVNP